MLGLLIGFISLFLLSILYFFDGISFAFFSLCDCKRKDGLPMYSQVWGYGQHMPFAAGFNAWPEMSDTGLRSDLDHQLLMVLRSNHWQVMNACWKCTWWLDG